MSRFSVLDDRGPCSTFQNLFRSVPRDRMILWMRTPKALRNLLSQPRPIINLRNRCRPPSCRPASFRKRIGTPTIRTQVCQKLTCQTHLAKSKSNHSRLSRSLVRPRHQRSPGQLGIHLARPPPPQAFTTAWSSPLHLRLGKDSVYSAQTEARARTS